MRKERFGIIVSLFVVVCLLIISFYVFTFAKFGISLNNSNWSSFGSYISGTIGTVLASFTIVLVYLTYKNQVINSTLQQFETTFFNLLQNQREILKSMKGRIGGHPFMELPNVDRIGDDYVDTIAWVIGQYYDAKLGAFNKPELEWSKEELNKKINANYNLVYKGKEVELGHYFRHLYHVIKYVHESNIPNKKKYIDIIQAQMSDNELYITFYNAISEYGAAKLLPLLDHYSFFENIRSRGKIFDKHKSLFYPNTQFKYNNQDK